MATIGILIGGAIINAAAFTGGNALYRALEGDDKAGEERKRHDLAQEKLAKDNVAWSEARLQYIDYINQQRIKAKQTNMDFSSVDYALREYDSFLTKKPVLSDYYTPSDGQKQSEFLFVIIGLMASSFISVSIL